MADRDIILADEPTASHHTERTFEIVELMSKELTSMEKQSAGQ